ncbi:unnamed protein product [Arabidopsis arenosa]|uniref:SWIM-type domain-containing protein n=1 Tax=Arabidopsis arenosa TaxID=38785 RepID=A0A8S2ASY6_ARAAE|nr:unnamed protein product [Arabidopsis arenosa]
MAKTRGGNWNPRRSRRLLAIGAEEGRASDGEPIEIPDDEIPEVSETIPDPPESEHVSIHSVEAVSEKSTAQAEIEKVPQPQHKQKQKRGENWSPRRSRRLMAMVEEEDRANDGEPRTIEIPEEPVTIGDPSEKSQEEADTETVSIPPVSTPAEAVNETVPQEKQKGKKRKKKTRDPEDIEEDRDGVSGDDCEVIGDEDCEEVGYANDVDGNELDNVDGGIAADNGNGGLDVDNGLEGAEEDNGDEGIEEEHCDDFEAEFGVGAREADHHSDIDADSGDEIWDDDRIPAPLSHSDDEEWHEDEAAADDAEDPEVLLRLNKTFNGPEEFKIAVLRYSLKTRYDIKLYRSQSLRIGAKCSSTDVKCPWRCYCSYDKKKHKMVVNIYDDEHACVRSGYSKMLKQGAIAWLYRERLRKNPKITKQEMVAEILREYNLTVTEDQCSKAKTKVLREMKVTHEEHFERIWDYQAEIFRSNPETKFEIETTPGTTIGSLQRFFRCFICFKAQRDSWKNTCRPIIGIDGAFLKWDVKGHLLAATRRDGDNRIVPIAWAVVEIENDDNWDWFLKMLSTSLELQDGRNVAIISDKQSGLVKAIQTVIPQAEHRQCARHIMDNWKRSSHDMDLQRLFWKIARSYTEGEFTSHMIELQRYNPSAYESLLKTNPRTWSRAFFRIGSCCNDNLNNLSESFNKTIRQARRKPLLDMLEDIRRQCMVRNEKRYVIAGRLKTRFTKRAHAEIEKMIVGSQSCERWLARHNKHQIKCGDMEVIVDMNTNTCGCRKWQMTGIPCIHAASVIIGKKQKVEDYVADWYTARMWELTYYDGIGPVQGKLLWPRVNRLGVLPPPWRRGNPGRPNNHARRKSLFETASSSSTQLSREHRVMTCSNCQQEGHNKQGCKNQTVTPPQRRPRGRPRKNQVHIIF